MRKYEGSHHHPHFSFDHHENHRLHHQRLSVDDVEEQGWQEEPTELKLEVGDDGEYLRSLIPLWGDAQERLCIGTLDVQVLEAANLPAADFGFSSDPYAILELTGFYGESLKRQYEWDPELRLSAKTQVVQKTLSALRVNILDKDEIGTDDSLGRLLIKCNDLKPGKLRTGWFLLQDPNDKSQEGRATTFSDDSVSGPAVRLVLKLEIRPVGEFCSFLWKSPKVVGKEPPRFDPNVFFSAVFSFKSKVIDTLSSVVGGVADAVSWKRPGFSIASFAAAIIVCHFIDQFWVIFHGAIAGFVIATGILTDAGAHPLLWPDTRYSGLRHDKLSATEDHSNVLATPAGGTTASTPAPKSNKPLFTGIKEITLRKAGRTVGKPIISAQASLVSASASAELLVNMVTWRKIDMKLGFKEYDGAFMAVGFIGGNIVMCACHLVFTLRCIAMALCVLLFSMPALQRVSKLMPQAVKQWKQRQKSNDGPMFHLERPSASSSMQKRSSEHEIMKILRGIFIRVDVDRSDTVTLEELLDATPHLSSEHKEKIQDAVHHANNDGNGEMTYREFESVVLLAGNSILRPLVVAELKREVLSDEGIALTSHPYSRTEAFWRFFGRSKAQRAPTSPVERLRGSAIRAYSRDHETPGNRGVMWKRHRRGQWMHVPGTSIIRVTRDRKDSLSILLEHGALDSTPARLLSFSLHHGSVRDALYSALMEVFPSCESDSRRNELGDGSFQSPPSSSPDVSSSSAIRAHADEDSLVASQRILHTDKDNPRTMLQRSFSSTSNY